MPEKREIIEEHLKSAEQAARNGLHGQALQHLDEAEKLMVGPDELNDGPLIEYRIKVLNNRGIIFKNLENFDESESCFKEALRLLDRSEGGSPKLPVGVHLNLANLMSRRGQYNPAMQHFQAALGSAKKLPEQQALDIESKIHNNLALFHCNFGEREKAHEELDKCLKCKSSDEFRIDFEKERRAWIFTNLGLIHSELGDEKELSESAEAASFRRAALGFFRQALDIYHKLDYSLMESRTFLNISTVERRLGMKGEAVEHLNAALEIADRLRSEKLRLMVLEQCVNHHLTCPDSPFGWVLDELFKILGKGKEPWTERVLRRVEDRARKCGKVDVLRRIRLRLRSDAPPRDSKGGVDDPVASGEI